MPCIFIVSRDWTLRAGVRAELREAGLDARGMESLGDAAEALGRGVSPAAVVLDGALERTPDDQAALANLARHVPILVVASHVEPGAAEEEWMKNGVEIVYRPVRVGEIVGRVRKLVEGQAA
jgi:DNA-binding NtrC family response regulator